MASIKLRDAAFFHRDLSHQTVAWEWLEEQLTEEQLERFAAIYRNNGLPSKPPGSSSTSSIDLALPLILEFEGCKLKAYPDPLSGGDPWTIGIGSTRYIDGTPVKRGDKITQLQAWNMLEFFVKQYETIQRERIPTWSMMSQQQQAAILSFAYNLGAHWFGSVGFATLTHNLRTADWGAVPQTLKLYRNPGSSVEAGLLRRRIAEGELWATGSWKA
jgi:GH24 family phage-related lysozyme (muramidase)